MILQRFSERRVTIPLNQKNGKVREGRLHGDEQTLLKMKFMPIWMITQLT